ncbi:MAG TPA: hypothetical protein VF475_17455 [Sphingobium sp.]
MSRDAMMMIRSDLIRRIDGIAASAGKISLAALCEQVDTIRRLARQHGLDAVEGLASMLETATAYHGHGPIILSYLDLMRDAVEAEQQDDHVRTVFTAALSLRLGA